MSTFHGTNTDRDGVVGRKLEDELAARLLLTLVERSHPAHDLDVAVAIAVLVRLLLAHASSYQQILQTMSGHG